MSSSDGLQSLHRTLFARSRCPRKENREGKKGFRAIMWSVRQKVMDLVLKNQKTQQLKKEARTDPRNRQWFIFSINILLSK